MMIPRGNILYVGKLKFSTHPQKQAGSAESNAIANQQGGGSTREHTHGFRGSLKILF